MGRHATQSVLVFTGICKFLSLLKIILIQILKIIYILKWHFFNKWATTVWSNIDSSLCRAGFLAAETGDKQYNKQINVYTTKDW